MNTAAVFQLIEQGLTLLPILVEGGVSIAKRVEQLTALAKGGADGSVSDADLARVRADFDADLTDFNTPMA